MSIKRMIMNIDRPFNMDACEEEERFRVVVVYVSYGIGNVERGHPKGFIRRKKGQGRRGPEIIT